MKIGTTDVSKIYIGSTGVTKVYLGATEVYSSSVEPTPPQPQPTTGDTCVLMHFDDSTNVAAADKVADVSVVADTGMPATIDTADFKFGTGSLASGNKSASDVTITLPETEPSVWTAECWVKGNSTKGNATFSTLTKNDSAIYNGFSIQHQYNKGTVKIRTANNTDTLTNTTMANAMLSTPDWIHIALVKLEDGTMYLGSSGTLMQVTNLPSWSNIFYIGLNKADSFTRTPCNVDEFRISKSNTLKDFNIEKLTYTVPTEAFTFSGESSGGDSGGETPTENTRWALEDARIVGYTKAGVEIGNYEDISEKLTYDTVKALVPSLLYSDSACTTEADIGKDGSICFVLKQNNVTTVMSIGSSGPINDFGTVVEVTDTTTFTNPTSWDYENVTVPAGTYIETTGDMRSVVLAKTDTLAVSSSGNLYLDVDTGLVSFIDTAKLTGTETKTMLYLGRFYQEYGTDYNFDANTEIKYKLP